MTKPADGNSPSFYVSLTIHDKILHNCLLDMGPSHNLMPKAVMEELGLDITRPYHDLFSFNSRKVKCLGLIKDLAITLTQLPMKSMVMDIVVVDVPPKFGMLLSRGWIKRLGGTLQNDLSYAIVPVFGGESRRLYREAQLAYIISDEKNPSNHPINAVNTGFGACILQIEESQKALLQLKKPIIQVEGEQGSQAAQKEDQAAVYKHNIGSSDHPRYINLSPHLSAAQSVEYYNLMKQFADVFAWEYSDLKTYDKKIIQHKIPLAKDTIPFKQKLRPINPLLLLLIEKEIKKLLAAKIIVSLRYSKWVANLMVVRKKNGEIRLYVDFRNLNKFSKKDKYPLPKMEHLLQKVSGAKVMSFLDGFSGYNQVVVHPDDQ
eukprot:PITA_16448